MYEENKQRREIEQSNEKIQHLLARLERKVDTIKTKLEMAVEFLHNFYYLIFIFCLCYICNLDGNFDVNLNSKRCCVYVGPFL